MIKYAVRLALFALLAFAGLALPSQAQTGSIRVVLAKAGLIVGAGGGRGVLTYRDCDYRFRVAGLSLGLTAGASVNRLVGRVAHLDKVEDFAGTYTAVGLGAALAGGVGGVQLRNAKGVIISLQGAKAGVEFAANLSGVEIVFE